MTASRYTDTFHPRVAKVSNALVEMTLQVTTEGIMLNKIPGGGEYRVVLDLGWQKAWERNKRWGEGNDIACDAE